jgi:hypothetical protein
MLAIHIKDLFIIRLLPFCLVVWLLRVGAIIVAKWKTLIKAIVIVLMNPQKKIIK